MKATLTLDCADCLEDLSLDITVSKKTMPAFGSIRRAAAQQGWHIGRVCRCPVCYEALPAICRTCCLFEGRKSMGASVCQLDGEFTAEDDFCPEHKPIHGYRNPIPTLD